MDDDFVSKHISHYFIHTWGYCIVSINNTIIASYETQMPICKHLDNHVDNVLLPLAQEGKIDANDPQYVGLFF